MLYKGYTQHISSSSLNLDKMAVAVMNMIPGIFVYKNGKENCFGIPVCTFVNDWRRDFVAYRKVEVPAGITHPKFEYAELDTDIHLKNPDSVPNRIAGGIAVLSNVMGTRKHKPGYVFNTGNYDELVTSGKIVPLWVYQKDDVQAMILKAEETCLLRSEAFNVFFHLIDGDKDNGYKDFDCRITEN